jgi:hypothetical protein
MGLVYAEQRTSERYRRKSASGRKWTSAYDMKRKGVFGSVSSHGKLVGASTTSPMQKFAMCATASALW